MAITVTKKSPFSGTLNSMTFGIEPKVFAKCIAEWQDGALIQNAFPMLSAEEREFIKTGITPTEWKETFGEE